MVGNGWMRLKCIRRGAPAAKRRLLVHFMVGFCCPQDVSSGPTLCGTCDIRVLMILKSPNRNSPDPTPEFTVVCVILEDKEKAPSFREGPLCVNGTSKDVYVLVLLY